MKTVTIEIPDDCEVKIVKKEEKKEPRIRTYQDLIDNSIYLNGYAILSTSDIINDKLWASSSSKKLALSEKVAKSMRAMAMISQLMPYYGEAITDEEWDTDDIKKYTISRESNNISSSCIYYNMYHFLAFHTQEQRDNFLKYNEQLVKDYLMIN